MLLTVQSVEVQNFMTHRQESVDFPTQGVVLLTGPSGAGKSSLLDAIGYALYGVNATRAASLDELRHELYPDEDMGARVTLSLGDERQIQVYRGVERGRSVAWMVDADGTLVEGLKAVTQRVSELMGGMDAATFFATYYSQQGELDQLVRKAGGERRKFVQRMLGINMLDDVSRRIRRETDKSADRMSFLDESLPAESKEELSAAVVGSRELITRSEALLEQLKVESEAATAQGQSLAEQVGAEKQKAERYRQLGPEIAALEETRLPALREALKRAEIELTEAEEAAQRSADNAQARTELEQLRQEADRLASAQGALEALERLRGEAEEAKQRLAQRKQDLEKMPPQPQASEDPEALSQQRQALLTEYRMLEGQIKGFADNRRKLIDNHECFTCLRPLPAGDEANAALAQLDEAIAKLQARQEEITAEGKQIGERLDAATAAREQADKLRRERERNETLVNEAEQAAQRMEQQLTQAEQSAKGGDPDRLREVNLRLRELSEQAARFEADEKLAATLSLRRQTLDEAQVRLVSEQERLAASKQELEKLEFDPRRFEQAERDLEQARERFGQLRDQTTQAKADLHTAQRDLEEAEKRLASYDRVVEERKQAAERHTMLKRLQQSMNDFKQHMIGQIRPALEARTSQHLFDLTEGRMPAVQIDDEYNLAIKRHGTFKRIGLCSGGEKARAAFALRLALTQLVSARTDTPVGLMVFDEIFGSQDPDHRVAILDSLAQLKGIYPQIFLISHEIELKESPFITTILDIPDADSVNRIVVSER